LAPELSGSWATNVWETEAARAPAKPAPKLTAAIPAPVKIILMTKMDFIIVFLLESWLWLAPEWKGVSAQYIGKID
jgi:hypothetical protein